MGESKKIKVLVVDDSHFMQKLIIQVLEQDSAIEVIGTAADGNEAFEKTQILHPDVITMDVKMPRLDGIAALEKIMSTCPTSTVMVSSYTKEGTESAIKSLQLGAIDFVAKPSKTGISLDLEEIAVELIRKVKVASRIKAIRTARRMTEKVELQREKSEIPEELEVAPLPKIEKGSVIVIASSTGGPQALNLIIPQLPINFGAAIIIVQHMPSRFTKELAKQLNLSSKILVKEGENREKIQTGIAFIAPGDYHLYITSVGRISLQKLPKIHGHRPSADITMRSVAEVYGDKCVGMVLSGMGSDGKAGIVEIKKQGGKVIAQDEETSVVFGMPKEAVSTGAVDWVLPVNQIGDFLVKLVGVKKDE